jgi:hypothetical protein
MLLVGLVHLDLSTGAEPYSWVLRHMAGLMPLVVGVFTAVVSVARPFGSLYCFTGLSPGVFLPCCPNM